jgi:pilus assembly protein CpaC
VKTRILQLAHPLSLLRAAFCLATAVIVSAVLVSSPVLAQTTVQTDTQTTAQLNPPPSPGAAIAAVTVPGAVNSITRVASGSETLHVVVGHSLFLNTKFRLRRVYVADPAVLNSVTLSPNQIIVTAMTPGVSSLILLDETGQAQSFVVSSDLDVQGLRTAISQAMRDDSVTVDGSGARVILSGTVGTQALADNAVKLASLYAKDVANSLNVVPEHPKQVRLKVRILEVDRSKLNQFGINLFNPGGNTSYLASTTTSQYPSTSTLTPSTGSTIGTLTTTNPLNFLLYSSKLNLGATVQDLESKNVLQILAEPTITTISGQKADFLSGGEFPFPIIQPGGGSSTNASVTIQFKPYGVKLEFTPVVNEDGTIRLKVAPEVSALDYTNAVSISGYTIPALSTRKAETEVELRSNQSFAISGLLDQRTTDLYSKTPGIASVPIIGALFKSKNLSHSTTELVVIITPTLVDPLTDTAEPVQPDVPVPTLNTDKFDKSLGRAHNPQPAAPPVNSAKPGFGSDATAPAAATSTPVNPSASVAPAPAPAPAQADPAPAQAAPVSAPAPPAAQPDVVATASVPVETTTTTAATPAPQPVVQPAPQPVAQPATQPAQAAAAPQPSSAPPQPVATVQPAPVAPAPSQPAAPTPSVSVVQVAPGAVVQVPQRYVYDDPVAAASAQQTAAPTPTMVQIMALSHKEDAVTMVAALKRRGYDVAISQDPRDSLLHLQIGPFTSPNDAEAMRQRLLREGYNATVR